MNMNFGKRRFVTGTLLVVSVLASMACNRKDDKRAEPDPLGYYAATDYQALDLNLNYQTQATPNMIAVEKAMRAGQPIAFRTLIDMIFQMQAGPEGQAKLWERLYSLASATSYEGVQINLLRQKFTTLLQAQSGRGYIRSNESSVAARLMANRGNSYASTLAFDFYLRIHLGANYPADRMVVIFTDNDMSLGQIQNVNGIDQLFEINGSGRLQEKVGRVLGPMGQLSVRSRIVSTNDFLFTEAMRMRISNLTEVVQNSVNGCTSRFSFQDSLNGQYYDIPNLNRTPFAWSSNGQVLQVAPRQARPQQSVVLPPNNGAQNPPVVVIPDPDQAQTPGQIVPDYRGQMAPQAPGVMVPPNQNPNLRYGGLQPNNGRMMMPPQGNIPSRYQRQQLPQPPVVQQQQPPEPEMPAPGVAIPDPDQPDQSYPQGQ